MSSCFSRCLRVPIAMRRFYGQSLWTPQKFLLTNLDFHHGLLTSNHWLTLDLVGHKSNRDGIGAIVKLVMPDGVQVATVTTAASYLSSSDKRVDFGLSSHAI